MAARSTVRRPTRQSTKKMTTRSAAKKSSRPTGRRAKTPGRAIARRGRMRKRLTARASSRPRRRSISAGSRRSSRSRMTGERFHNRIKKIKNDLSPRLRVQDKTIGLINSLLNDILYHVTLKAKSNISEYKKKTLTYTDILVSAMNLFGESNKWIEKIMQKGEKSAMSKS